MYFSQALKTALLSDRVSRIRECLQFSHYCPHRNATRQIRFLYRDCRFYQPSRATIQGSVPVVKCRSASDNRREIALDLGENYFTACFKHLFGDFIRFTAQGGQLAEKVLRHHHNGQ